VTELLKESVETVFGASPETVSVTLRRSAESGRWR
jgi:hypothetical protein